MGKNRYISTAFRDDGYIVERDPIEKLLFMYFLTNTLTNIAGIYEIPIRRIAYDTGIDKEMVIKIIDRFSKNGKIFYIDGRIYIKNFQKHQNTKNPQIKKGIEEIIKLLPDNILNEIRVIDDSYMTHIGLPNNSIKSNLIKSNLIKSNSNEIETENDLLSHKGDNTKSDDFELSNYLEKKKEMVQGMSIGDINNLEKEKEKSSVKKEKEKSEIVEYIPKAITTDINNFIDKLKSECEKRGVAYLSKNDRNFAKFILTAKDYGDFANGIGQTREQFAINILDASIKINYWKGICSGPMSIYQNYQDVFNQTKLRTKKESEKKVTVAIAPSIWKS